MKKITVVALGYKDISGMSVEGYRALFECNTDNTAIICRTSQHAVIDELSARGIQFSSLDSFYDDAESFDSMYDAMLEYVLDTASQKDVILCVSGSAAFGDQLTQKLSSTNDVELKIINCPGVAEHISNASGTVFGNGYSVIPAHMLQHSMINTRLPLFITEVDNKFLAGEIKLMLLEHYPDDHEVLYFYSHPDTKNESIELFDLDRQKIYDFSVNFVILPLDNFGKKLYDITALCEIMRILRGNPPESDIGAIKYDERGCSWDREQSHDSIRVNLIEEAYEVVQAINSKDTDNLIEELGDVLLQVVFHAQIASEHGDFTFSDVVQGVVDKLVRRHPHVFGDVVAQDADQALASWDDVKKQEKTSKTLSSSLNSIPKELSPLTRAAKVVSKAEKASLAPEYSAFTRGIMRGLVEAEIDDKDLGELLFAIAHAAKQLGYEPDIELIKYTDKVISDITYKESKSI